MKKTMAIAIITIVLLAVSAGTAGATSSGIVSRTVDKNWLNSSNPLDKITVTVTGTNADFRWYGVQETMPENMNVALPASEGTSVQVQQSGSIYTFVGVQGSAVPVTNFTLTYFLTANNGAQTGAIQGTFRDSDKNDGTIMPSTNTIRITTDVWQMYDTDGDGTLDKNEVIAAAVDYFTKNTLTFGDIVSIVRHYLYQ